MCFSPYWGIGHTGGGGARDWYTTSSCCFLPWTTKKSQFSDLVFDTMITQNDHPRYVKHILAHIYAFLTLFGHWAHRGGGGPKGLVHNLVIQLFPLGSSKN